MQFERWDKKLKEIKENSVVVSPVGGKGSRMLSPEIVRGAKTYTIKALIRLGEETLIERFIHEYEAAGIKRFVFLLGNGGEEIKRHLNDKQFDVEINYSFDPPVKKVGKGKALKYAFDKGVIPEKGYMYFGFPDDVILYPFWIDEATPRFVYYNELSDVIGLVVFVKKIESPYGTAKIADGYVERFEEKPKIEMPVSTGRAIFDIEKLKPYLDSIDIDAEEAIEFEKVVLPKLAKEKKLTSYFIPENAWIPINTFKDLKKAKEYLYKI